MKFIVKILGFLLLIIVLHFQNANAQDSLYQLDINNLGELREYFYYTKNRIPQVSSHRGGAVKGYPENCVATFENTMRHIPTFFEVDPRLTKDSVIVILHDATLDRTTDGKGKLSDYTWEEIKHLRLKDPQGNLTMFNIPLLDEVLKWAKGKTLLMLDKKDVPMKMLLEKINDHHAESYVLVSSYRVEEALFYHQNNENIMFEAFIRDKEELQQYETSGIPWHNIVAYIVRPKNKYLFNMLHERGVMCIVYTAKNIEKLPKLYDRQKAYRELIRSGTDIILADNVIEVYESIRPLVSERSNQHRFFRQPTEKAISK